MLGILGGMGPMATVDFMAKIAMITPARTDQEHMQIITASAANIPDRTAAILGHGEDPLPAMQTALARLERAGADRIAIPCNTAHYWHSSLQERTALPILHIVDAVLAQQHARNIAPQRLGLLATDGTIAANVYRSRLAPKGIECLLPDASAQAQVMQAIRLVKAGQAQAAADILRVEAKSLIANGASHVVMGCTEIPIALAHEAPELSERLLDPTMALAEACVAAERSLTPI